MLMNMDNPKNIKLEELTQQQLFKIYNEYRSGKYTLTEISKRNQISLYTCKLAIKSVELMLEDRKVRYGKI